MSYRLLAGLLLAVSSGALAQDRIIQKDGKTIPAPGAQQKIQVTEEGIQQITYKIVGVPAPQGVATSKVDRVEYGEKSTDYDQATQSLRRGDFADAIEKFTKLAETNEPMWVKPYSLFNIGEAYRLSGEADKAIAAYNKLVGALPKSRFVPEARLDVAICLTMKKDVDGAKVALQKLKEDAAKQGFSEAWINRANFQEIQIVQGTGGYPEAITRYNELAAKVEKDDPQLASQCRLQIGDCYSKQGDHKKAFDFYKAIVESASASPEMLAGAHRGMGLALFNMKQIPEAQMEFLRVVVIGDQNEGDIPDDTVADSMLYAGQCFELLKEKQPDGPARGQKLYREIIRNYPGTKAAADAKHRLKGL
ncbi:MAG: tetratricopeptide repeat protein [Planctomycetes bacterium]|nr:tetratricopeptide repeat protein [Planctomycetota bacterium]MBI3843266.1 tetratricopeptide repeat protein [Planctomycetota bacterium]